MLVFGCGFLVLDRFGLFVLGISFIYSAWHSGIGVFFLYGLIGLRWGMDLCIMMDWILCMDGID